MAISHVIKQGTGNEVRSAMSMTDMDGNATFLTGTVIGADIGTTDVDGNDIHVINTQAYTSAAEMTGNELMQAWAEKISDPVGGVAGARAFHTQNTDNEYIMHVESLRSEGLPEAWNVSLATPTFVAGV